ncbi:hypothetical protein P43SY_002581 [Pythium insidiosum]|uniref:Uncharacterized protein n=1 Tax=Pythium insidiosum TaxID=114742 RepID=A0AAD5LRD1_PYTIN|nr:hypothetical protein P43SY_002581 [Pythium insidiosum]
MESDKARDDVVDLVNDTASEGGDDTTETHSAIDTDSCDEVELRVVSRHSADRTVADDDASVSDDKTDEDVEEAPAAANKCATKPASAKAKGASQSLSKSDVSMAETRQPRKLRKPVFKNEFKESNFAYYEETVTLFCAQDFFAAKKLSQSLLNDQIRSRRVQGPMASVHVARFQFLGFSMKLYELLR